MALTSRIQHWQKIRTRFDAQIAEDIGENSNVPTTVATRMQAWNPRRATTASLGYQPDSASTVEQRGNVLLHGLAERLIHLGGLKAKSGKTSRLF